MKVRIVIKTMNKDGNIMAMSQVWSGEMDILRDDEYLMKLSIIAEGEPQPICDVPFSLGTGYYLWIPPEVQNETEIAYALQNKSVQKQ